MSSIEAESRAENKIDNLWRTLRRFVNRRLVNRQLVNRQFVNPIDIVSVRQPVDSSTLD